MFAYFIITDRKLAFNAGPPFRSYGFQIADTILLKSCVIYFIFTVFATMFLAVTNVEVLRGKANEKESSEALSAFQSSRASARNAHVSRMIMTCCHSWPSFGSIRES